MNHRQKFGYMILGAVIMLVGLGVGAIVSPPLIAQRNGVFGEIKCTKLEVVNKYGKPAIRLEAYNDNDSIVRNSVKIYHLKPNRYGVLHEAISLEVSNDNDISVRNSIRMDNPKPNQYGLFDAAIELRSSDNANSIKVYDPDRDLDIRRQPRKAIGLESWGSSQNILVVGKEGREISLNVADSTAWKNKVRNDISIFDSESKLVWTAP